MTKPIPEGCEGLIPHLKCEDCAAAIEFYKKAFDAVELSRMPAADGKRIMHAALNLGGQNLFLADEFPEYCGGKTSNPKALGGTPIVLHRYVEDCDAAMAQAEQAGAKVDMPAMDMFWGDRYGVVTDPFGFSWSLATHQRDLTPAEMAEGFQQMLQQAPQPPA